MLLHTSPQCFPPKKPFRDLFLHFTVQSTVVKPNDRLSALGCHWPRVLIMTTGTFAWGWFTCWFVSLPGKWSVQHLLILHWTSYAKLPHPWLGSQLFQIEWSQHSRFTQNCTILDLVVNIMMNKTDLFIVPNVALVHCCASFTIKPEYIPCCLGLELTVHLIIPYIIPTLPYKISYLQLPGKPPLFFFWQSCQSSHSHCMREKSPSLLRYGLATDNSASFRSFQTG